MKLELNLVFVVALHPGVLAKFDPKCMLVESRIKPSVFDCPGVQQVATGQRSLDFAVIGESNDCVRICRDYFVPDRTPHA